jgi:hypothetical protein
LRGGDVEVAASNFAAEQKRFALASDDLGRPWGAARATGPGIAQNRDALAGLTSAAADVTAVAAGSLDEIDLDALRLVDGRIDLDAIRALEGPFSNLESSLDLFDRVVRENDSPWLVAPLAERLHDVAETVREQPTAPQKTGCSRSRYAPDMLGYNGARATSSPSRRRRRLGGSVASWATGRR